jgi:hypothetical protein
MLRPGPNINRTACERRFRASSGHSTMVPARNRKGSGMFSLMALAVLRFITSSNFVRQIAGLLLLKAHQHHRHPE